MMANNITLLYNLSLLNSKLTGIINHYRVIGTELAEKDKEMSPEVQETMLKEVQDAIDVYHDSQIRTVSRMRQENNMEPPIILPRGTPW